MGIFRKKDTAVQSPPAPAQHVVAPESGKISLTKGSSVTLTKSSSSIVASNGWTAKNKDYDLKALVRYRHGETLYIGAANPDELHSTPEGAVRHGGDVTRPGDREEITIKWHPDIASVALSSYSALENGSGSFREYGVFVEIQNGQQVIGLAAADANANSSSYTLFFGEVVFEPDGRFTVTNHEKYSEKGSEHRIGYQGDKVVMDSGPVGEAK